MSYFPIIIQRMDPDTEQWSNLLHLHALQVNRTGGGESFSAGRERPSPRLTFDIRWCKAVEEIRWDTQSHRILYLGHTFNITDYDDYMEQHITVRLTGEAYG